MAKKKTKAELQTKMKSLNAKLKKVIKAWEAADKVTADLHRTKWDIEDEITDLTEKIENYK
jgi:hypothetical protein